MKKKIICLTAAAVLALSLMSGCGESDSADESDMSEETLNEESEEAPGEEAEETKQEEVQEEAEEEEAAAEEVAETASSEETLSLAAPSVNGALHVEGTQLTDENGDPVQLRGISTHGLGWFPEYVNAECLADLHSWGANVIRLAMYTAESGGYCTDGDQEALKDLVREGVKEAAEEDMYVIVDWHVLSDLSPLTYQTEAEDFFDEMSKEFADYDNVLYEICNEPNGDTQWSEIKAYAEDIIPIIRENDEDAVIIVGTPTWSQDVDQAAADPIEDYDNIMYTLHFYAATHKDDLRAKMTEALDNGLPVFVTEYGICDASGNGEIDEESANTWINLLNEYGVSYVMWNLSNKDESSSILASTVNKTSGFEEADLSQSGQWLYGMLKAALSGEGPVTTGGDAAEDQTGEADEGSSGEEQNGNLPEASGEGMTVTVSQTNSWEEDGHDYYMYNASVKNTSGAAVTSWEVELTFDGEIECSDGWNGTYSADGSTLTISSADYNGALADGEEAEDVGFIIFYH